MARVSSSQSFAFKLLKILALSGAVIVVASNPYFGLNMVRGIKKHLKKRKWAQFYRSLHKLKQQRKIDIYKNKEGNYQVNLTMRGQKVVERLNLDDLVIPKPKQWDGQWRFFSFDIPVYKKAARHALLSKLKELGFILVQRSLWAYPFECRRELMIIAKAFEVAPHVLYISAGEVSGGEWLKRKFSKQNPAILI